MKHCVSFSCLFPINFKVLFALPKKYYHGFWVIVLLAIASLYTNSKTNWLTTIAVCRSSSDIWGLSTSSACFTWLIHIAATIWRVCWAVRATMTSLTFLEVGAGCWLWTLVLLVWASHSPSGSTSFFTECSPGSVTREQGQEGKASWGPGTGLHVASLLPYSIGKAGHETSDNSWDKKIGFSSW